MKDCTIGQLGWIGGIVDGEGCIALGRKKRRYYTPYVTVTNTSMLMHSHLKRLTSMGVIRPLARDKTIHKDTWAWCLRVEEQKIFLTSILPYLVVKSEQAELLLEYHSIPTHTMTDENLSLKSIICDELAELNKRGPRHN